MNQIWKLWMAGALLLPGLGQAANLGYTYIEGGYAETELDIEGTNLDADGDGFGVAGSIAIAPNWHLVAAYSTADLEVDGLPVDIDVDTISVGVGGNQSISERADIIGRVLYVEQDAEFSSPLGSAAGDEDGFGVQLRVRGEVVERFELEGGVNYIDLGEDDTSFNAEGRYFLTEMFAIGAGVDVGDDFTTYGVALRLKF